MKSFAPKTLLAVLLILAAWTPAALAGPVRPGPFTTTGYATAFDMQALPSGYVKLRIQSQGGAAVGADSLCSADYGAPCGAHGYFEGWFFLDEWGLGNPTTGQGVNYGLLTVTTPQGTAKALFGGVADVAHVAGAFTFLSGTGDYAGIRGTGGYTGNTGYDNAAGVFKVVYQPWDLWSGNVLSGYQCTIRSRDSKVKRDRFEWSLDNEGETPVTVSSVLVHWPDSNGALTTITLDGKTLATPGLSQRCDPASHTCWAEVTAVAGDRKNPLQIRAGKTGQLTFEFSQTAGRAEPSDYTVLVRFAEGCAVPLVAFPDHP